MLLSDSFNWESQGLPYDSESIKEIAKVILETGEYTFSNEDIEHAKKIMKSASSILDLAYSILWFVVPMGLAIWVIFFL